MRCKASTLNFLPNSAEETVSLCVRHIHWPRGMQCLQIAHCSWFPCLPCLGLIDEKYKWFWCKYLLETLGEGALRQLHHLFPSWEIWEGCINTGSTCVFALQIPGVLLEVTLWLKQASLSSRHFWSWLRWHSCTWSEEQMSHVATMLILSALTSPTKPKMFSYHLYAMLLWHPFYWLLY